MSLQTKNLSNTLFLSFLGLVLFLSGGCTPKVTVSPLDRGYLADYLMKTDRDKLSVKMFDHGYFSREASRGGRGA